ncbi:hypothetical protein K438DRAFT_1756860 [Mycena galopus ATCC 62051]|nr:hypothetical protein K438DRAFT_1756860 [Mycena galopus ATCC 62051]
MKPMLFDARLGEDRRSISASQSMSDANPGLFSTSHKKSAMERATAISTRIRDRHDFPSHPPTPISDTRFCSPPFPAPVGAPNASPLPKPSTKDVWGAGSRTLSSWSPWTRADDATYRGLGSATIHRIDVDLRACAGLGLSVQRYRSENTGVPPPEKKCRTDEKHQDSSDKDEAALLPARIYSALDPWRGPCQAKCLKTGHIVFAPRHPEQKVSCILGHDSDEIVTEPADKLRMDRGIVYR